jgi:heavy metal sensor kinase
VSGVFDAPAPPLAQSPRPSLLTRWWPRWLDGLPLRFRLTLWYVALLAVVLTVFGGYLYSSLEQRLMSEIDRSLETQARRLTPPPDAPPGPPPALVGRRRQATGSLAISVYDARGQDLLFGEILEDLPELERARQAAGNGTADLQTVETNDDEFWRVLTTPILQAGQQTMVVQIARSEVESETALRELLLLLLIGIPATLVLAIAIGLFLAGRALDPIDRITRTAAQIEAGDLSRRLHLPQRRDEVGRLAATFDAMLDRLEASFARQRRFTADASHELRTPLAIMISQADVALERARSAEEYREVLDGILGDARRMSQLLGDLLTLARADDGKLDLGREPLDLDELAEDVVATMTPLADDRGICLDVRLAEHAAVDADQTRLTQLLVNLVDNALKYTPAGGSVMVVVDRVDGDAILRVADTGVGIAASHLPRIFERFYRVDASRARSMASTDGGAGASTDGGAGLGLAICRWIVEAHGGTIEVESKVGKGTTFTVRLPTTPIATPDEARVLVGSNAGAERR